MKSLKIDKMFLWIVSILVGVGFFLFVSAALGTLDKNESKFYSVLMSQGFGLIGGILVSYICYKIPYTFWKKYSLVLFICSILLVLMVFIPSLTLEHNGARRWVSLGFISFQPVEFLKIAFIIYAAAWLSYIRGKIHDAKFSVIPFLCVTGIIALVLAKQPDTKSLILIFISGIAMLFVSGIKWKYLGYIALVGVVGFSLLLIINPYTQSRVKTFLKPDRDPADQSFQIQQSLIAIGSGKIFGRGFGQSIEKFSKLPEPQGDAIFAVIGEEFGFIGTMSVVILFVMFALRGLRIANMAPDMFSRLLVTGIVILFTTQAFLNIASFIGIFPLTGVPLVFISHGGTSLMVALASIGIILNISKYQKNKALSDKEIQ